MIELNYRDQRPIYEQIKDGLKKLMMAGGIQKDEKLPSVRELASTLAINPNTIQKALKELETEGWIYTVAGKGSFAAGKSDVDVSRQQELYRVFDSTVKELLYLTEDKERLKRRIDTLGEGGEIHD